MLLSDTQPNTLCRNGAPMLLLYFYCKWLKTAVSILFLSHEIFNCLYTTNKSSTNFNNPTNPTDPTNQIEQTPQMFVFQWHFQFFIEAQPIKFSSNMITFQIILNRHHLHTEAETHLERKGSEKENWGRAVAHVLKIFNDYLSTNFSSLSPADYVTL